MAQKFKCEHCNSQVEVARVCAKCGQEHSEEWTNKNSQIESQNNLNSMPAICYLAYRLGGLLFSDIPIKQWPMIDIIVIAFCITIITTLLMFIFGKFRIKPIEERQLEKQVTANIKELIKQANK